MPHLTGPQNRPRSGELGRSSKRRANDGGAGSRHRATPRPRFLWCFPGPPPAVGVQFGWADINWWVVGVCAAFGFVLVWFVGEGAIEFLKSVFWWS